MKNLWWRSQKDILIHIISLIISGRDTLFVGLEVRLNSLNLIQQVIKNTCRTEESHGSEAVTG